MLLLSPLYLLVRTLHGLVTRYGPTNRLLSWFRQRQNLRWGLLAAPVSLTYVLVAVLISAYADNPGYGWLYLPFLIIVWNALKLAAWAPISLIHLAVARSRDRRSHRTSSHSAAAGETSDTRAVTR